jgi:hypothetical protein
MMGRAWLRSCAVIGFALAIGCSVDPGSGDSGQQGSESSTTGDLPSCPADGGARLEFSIDFPLPADTNREADAVDQQANCTIDSVGGDAMAGWELALTCNFEGGPIAQSGTIAITAPSSPFAALATDQAVALQLYRWWGFEVGGGTRLALAQGGATMVVVYSEEAAGGINTCATATDSNRAAADAWLAPVGARIESAECVDPAVLRLARTAGGEEFHVHPGEFADVGDGMQALVHDARCHVELGGEFWSLTVGLWQG